MLSLLTADLTFGHDMSQRLGDLPWSVGHICSLFPGVSSGLSTQEQVLCIPLGHREPGESALYKLEIHFKNLTKWLRSITNNPKHANLGAVHGGPGWVSSCH